MLHCTSLVLTADAALRRNATRRVEWRQAAYDEEFDATTLFYDVVAAGHGLVFIGPPLHNLLPAFRDARLDQRRISATGALFHLRHRCCDVWTPWGTGGASRLELGRESFEFTPQPTAHHLYRGRRVLYTLSKDNEVAWIVDWARFHVSNHGADAVLIYDNASSKYSGDTLESSLRKALPGLEINVVHWPYKYGPQGISDLNGWDSDFCQAGAFHDARFRFLADAASVLNCDVDEFVVSDSGASIFASTERSADGYLLFAGSWLSSVLPDDASSPGTPSELRHWHFRFLERARVGGCPTKWCVVPRRCMLEEQWSTHSVLGRDAPVCELQHFSYRHFRSISTSWKYQRHWPATYDPRRHQFDPALDRSLARAGMARHRAGEFTA
jgi:hypothetical protein